MVEVTIERIVPGGLGLAHDDDGVLFVPGALKGERVAVTAHRRTGGVRQARTFDVIEPAPGRQAQTDCQHHPACGGCDFLHFSNAARRAALLDMVYDGLRRQAKLSAAELETVSPIIVGESAVSSGEVDQAHGGDRRRVRVTVGPDGRVGFFARASHHVIGIDRCAALTEALNLRLQKLAALHELPPGTKIRLAIDDRGHASAALEGLAGKAAQALSTRLIDAGVANGVVVMTDGGHVAMEFGDATLEGEIASDDAGGPYRHCAATFSQATRSGAQAITKAVLAALAGRDVGEGYLLELFAGAGHLTFPLARLGFDVTAVEGAPRAAGWLRDNLDRSHLDRSHLDRNHLDGSGALPIRCLLGNIDGRDFSDTIVKHFHAFPDVVVADPPRSGIPHFAGILDALAPTVLVLISCDIATGARDLAIARRYGYRVEKLTVIDNFPRTSHVEWVAVLVEQAPGEAEEGDESEGVEGKR